MIEYDSVVTAERVQLLHSNSPKAVHYENGDAPGEGLSIVWQTKRVSSNEIGDALLLNGVV